MWRGQQHVRLGNVTAGSSKEATVGTQNVQSMEILDNGGSNDATDSNGECHTPASKVDTIVPET